MTIWTVLSILMVSVFVTASFSQKKTFFDEKIEILSKPISVEFIQVKSDTLASYFDALIKRSAGESGLEMYRFTSASASPSDPTTTKYFELKNGFLVSSEVFLDKKKYVFLKITYANDFTERFRLLIDSAFWRYRKPAGELEAVVHDGASYKIDGWKEANFMTIEKTNPAKYDTLFNLTKSFFWKY